MTTQLARAVPLPLLCAALLLLPCSASAEPPARAHARPFLLLLPVAGQPPPAAFRMSAFSPAPHADPWWGPDKALHLSIAALLAGGGYALGSLVTGDRVGRVALGADLALSAALAKEAADEAGLGTPSWRDFTWGVLGTALGVSVSLAVDLGVQKATSPAR